MNRDDWLIKNAEGSVLSPLFTLQVHIILFYHFCCLFIGLPINIHIFNSIFHEYLVNGKPIDFLLLSRILSALFTLIVTFAEIIYDVALPSAKDGLCRFHVALLGLPHLIFLLNLLLSLVDCYQTRENKVTISPFSILALNLLVALVVNWIYVSGWAPLTCAYHKIHLATLVTVLFVLFIPCAVLIVILQMKNKDKRRRQRLSDSKTVAVSRLFSTRRPTHQVID